MPYTWLTMSTVCCYCCLHAYFLCNNDDLISICIRSCRCLSRPKRSPLWTEMFPLSWQWILEYSWSPQSKMNCSCVSQSGTACIPDNSWNSVDDSKSASFWGSTGLSNLNISDIQVPVHAHFSVFVKWEFGYHWDVGVQANCITTNAIYFLR